ncbi:MAG: hypothetical protein Q9M15_06950 [Mariprofundaceae bacterium]|nr:hypothetical protein [Mariprofundaceae bacterium]
MSKILKKKPKRTKTIWFIDRFPIAATGSATRSLSLSQYENDVWGVLYRGQPQGLPLRYDGVNGMKSMLLLTQHWAVNSNHISASTHQAIHFNNRQ